MARACPYPKPSKKGSEAMGRTEGTMTAIHNSESESEDRVEELRRQLREAEMTQECSIQFRQNHGWPLRCS